MRSLILVSWMLLGVGHARAALGSPNSVYFSSYCQKYKCALEDRGFSHADGVDYGQFKYRLLDGSVLIQHRYVPFDASKIYPSDDEVALLTLELPKKLNVAQLERRLMELVNYGSGSQFSRFPFDFAHKCNRPETSDFYPWDGPGARENTFVVRGRKYELTCVWSEKTWAFNLHRGFIFPTFRPLERF
jgi:hypothetical protein